MTSKINDTDAVDIILELHFDGVDSIVESRTAIHDEMIPFPIPPPLDKLQTIERIHTDQTFSTFGKRTSAHHCLTPPKTLHSRSAENLKHRYKADGSTDESSQITSSIYLDVNDYKTFFGVGDESPHRNIEVRRVEPKYTWEYDSDTLKALSRVTKKFDSFRMRQLRANCFNAGVDTMVKVEETHPEKGDPSSMNNRTNDNKLSIFCEKHLREKIASEKKTNSPEIQPQALILSPEETERIDFFYSSLGCQTYVAGCVVDVLASVRGGDSLYSESPGYRWVQVWVGVPVLVFNIGNDKRKPRKLTIVIAQRDTGLTLWAEPVTYSTDYRQIENEGLHLLNEGRGGKRAVKIRWSDWDCARAFMERFKQLTTDRNDPLWLQGSSQPPLDPKLLRKKSKAIFKKRDVKKHRGESLHTNSECQTLKPLEASPASKSGPSEYIRKKDISLPVNVRVMTRIDSKDVNFRTTFAGLLPVPLRTKSWFVIQDEEFRPRLPTN